MKRVKFKNKIITAASVLIILLIAGRIAYVNIFYEKTREETFNAEDYFDYRGLTYKIQGVERYAYDDYDAKYKDGRSPLSYEGVVWILNLDVSNKTSEDLTADYPGISLSVGAASNGFDLGDTNYINKDFSWQYEPGESKNIKLVYIINCSYMSKKQYNQMLEGNMQIAVADYELLRRTVLPASLS